MLNCCGCSYVCHLFKKIGCFTCVLAGLRHVCVDRCLTHITPLVAQQQQQWNPLTQPAVAWFPNKHVNVETSTSLSRMTPLHIFLNSSALYAILSLLLSCFFFFWKCLYVCLFERQIAFKSHISHHLVSWCICAQGVTWRATMEGVEVVIFVENKN